MPGFTSEEVQTSIDRFLLNQVAVPRLQSGSRDILAARNTIYDLITTTLLLRTDSYFYVIWLASNALRGIVNQQISAIDTIDTSGAGVGRPAKLVDSTTELTNAQAALLELNAGLNTRTTGVSGSIGPAVTRFNTSVERFINDELTKNVVDSGQVVETADELRALISTTWAAAVTRHDEITRRLTLLSAAISALRAIRLPESSVRDIVSKIQTRLDELKTTLEGTDAVAQSREAFLDLLTMRTLLRKASSFRDPLLTLMPLTGDPTTGTIIDSGGTAPAVTSTVSAPFNYDVGEDFRLTINGGTSTPLVVAPAQSNAQVRSRAITSFPIPAAPTAYHINLTYSGGTKTAIPFTSIAASGSALAAEITTQASLSPEVTCTWDATNNQLVFTDLNEGDDSLLRFNEDSVSQSEFTAEIFGGELREGRATPQSADDLVAAIRTQAAGVDVTVDETVYASFTGIRPAAATGSIRDVRVEGTNLVTDTSSLTVSSPTTNFEDLGVQVGWGIRMLLPFTQTLLITAVSGNTLTVNINPSATTTVGEYFIGPDYSSIPVGARVQTTGGDSTTNTGFRRVSSSLVGEVVLDIALPDDDTAVYTTIYTRFLSLTARDTTTTTGLGVLFGSTALGLAVSAEAPASLSTLQIASGDFLARGVKVGDLVDLVAPSTATFSVEVVSLTTRTLTFTPSVAYEAGNWTYTITSFRHSRYTTLSGEVDTYNATAYAGDDFDRLDPLVGRLIRGAQYTGTISTPLLSYRGALVKLRDALDAYQIPREVTVDQIVRTMREQGFDRAADLFLALDIGTFFGMDADEVSYATNFVRKAATAAREVVPVSKFARSRHVNQEFRQVSYQPDPFDPRDDDDRRDETTGR